MFNLICQNLAFCYPPNPAFRLSVPDLSCDLQEPFGVYGLTGSGKSTFGKILGGLLVPTGGSFKFEWSGSADPIQNIAPRVLYLPQFPESIFLGMSIGNALKTMLKSQDDASQLTALFATNLQRLGLEYGLIRSRYGYELSAGELRLATIALGLTRAADLTIFDEPTIALSPQGRNRFIDIIGEFAAQKALMIISHDYRLVRKLCRNVLIFGQGNVIFKGEWEELDQNPSVIKSIGTDLLEGLIQRDIVNGKKSD